MRLLIGLVPRMIIGAAVITVAAVILTALVYIRGANDLISSRVGSFVQELMREDGLGCARHPERFGFVLPNGSRVDAYDASTLRSANPATPPLSATLAEAIRGGRRRVLVDRVIRGEGGDLLIGVGPDGPCSLVRIHWTSDPGLRLQAFAGFALLIAATLVFVLGALALWVVRPLLARIRFLAAEATRVGAPGAQVGERGGEGDELAVLERALGAAHRRILHDRGQLEAQHEALSTHLAHVAHDLRTPIAALQLALERERASGHRSQALDAAIADAMYLESLADNLRMETALSRELEAEGRADLGAIVERVQARLRPLAESQGVDLQSARPDGEVAARGPELHLERAVANLVENAIRHNAPGGHVAVVLEDEGERFRLEVEDDGPGAPAEVLEALLEPGYRADEARRRDRRGAGLGLTITREVCRRAGLELSLERGEPRGLLVRIRGPRLPPP